MINESFLQQIDMLDLQKSFASIPFEEDLHLCLWNNPIQRDFATEDKYANFKVIFKDRVYNFIKPIVCPLARTFDQIAQHGSVFTVNQPYEPELFHKCMLLLAGNPSVEIKKEEKLNFTEIVFQLGIDTENFQKRLIENLKNTMNSQNVLQTAELAFKYLKQDLLDAALASLQAKFRFEPLKDYSATNKLSPGLFEMIINTHNTSRITAKQAGEQVSENFLNSFQISNLVSSYCKMNMKLFRNEQECEGFQKRLLSQVDFEEPVPTPKDVKKDEERSSELEFAIEALMMKLDKTNKRLEKLEFSDKQKNSELFGMNQRLSTLELDVEKLELKEADAYVERFKSVTKGPGNNGWLHSNKLDVIAFMVTKNIRLAAISFYLPHTPPKVGTQPIQQLPQQSTLLANQGKQLGNQSTIMPNQSMMMPNQSTMFQPNQSTFMQNQNLQSKVITSPTNASSSGGTLYPQMSTFGAKPQGPGLNAFGGMEKSNLGGGMMGQQQQLPPYQMGSSSFNAFPAEPVTIKGTLRVIEGEYVDGPVIAEKTFEGQYKHTPGKGDQTMEKVRFDRFVRLKANQWYLIVQTAFGPQTFFGENGQESVTKGDVTFVFKSLKDFPNNNGTDMTKGQIPRLYFSQYAA